jgi:hypothetical protein
VPGTGVPELPLGSVVLRLDCGVIELIDRDRVHSLRIHVNHAAARFEPRRDGSLRVALGWPRNWVYGMPGGPGADLTWDDLQPGADFTVDPGLEPAIRGLLNEAAARRTMPLPGAPLP